MTIKLAIVKLSLGDVIHAIPVARALRRARPGIHLAWIVEAREYALLKDHPDLDTVVPVDTRLWRRLIRRPSGVREVVGKVGPPAGAHPRGALRRRPRSAGPHQERAAHRLHRRAAAHRLHRRSLPRGPELSVHEPPRAPARRGGARGGPVPGPPRAARHPAGAGRVPRADPRARHAAHGRLPGRAGREEPRPAGGGESRARAARTSSGRSRTSGASWTGSPASPT